MRHSVFALIAGLFFGLGLVISGMVQPTKVKAFLDFFGQWDPSLAFVMIGAILTHMLAYRFIKHKSSPLLGGGFQLPTKKDLDGRLIFGALMFGAGWGLAGFCPGPAITSIFALNSEALIFAAAMIAGMLLFAVFQKFILR